MHVERILSLNDGWAILTTQKNSEWQEAIHALSMIDNQVILDGLKQLERAKAAAAETEEEVVTRTTTSYFGFYIHTLYNDRLRYHFEWHDILPQVVPGSNLPIEPKAVKNGVSASIVGTDSMTGGDFASNLYLDIPYYTHSGLLEVSVILIPTTEAINHFTLLGAKPIEVSSVPTEEFCRAKATKFSSLTSKAPVVLAFFSPTAPTEITIEEATPLKVESHNIERTIEFAPEYYQASVGLLSYFGEILRQKDPNTKAKVRIEQEGNRVRLHIESPGGDIEIIEKQLEQYALVISKQAEPETLLANRAHIMQLETQLDVARIQVKQAQDLMQLAAGQHTQRINSLEKQIEFLQTQFAIQILQTEKVINLATKQNDSHERVQTAMLSNSQLLFKDLIHEARDNQRLAEAVSSLQHNLLSGLAIIDVEDKLEQALSTIKETKPSFLGRILKELEGAAYKASASSSISWAAKWIAAHYQANNG